MKSKKETLPSYHLGHPNPSPHAAHPPLKCAISTLQWSKEEHTISLRCTYGIQCQLNSCSKPIRHTKFTTCHIDMKEFFILQWTEEESIFHQDAPSALNVGDTPSKPTGRTKFHEHMDIMMGQCKPNYVKSTNAFLPSFSTCNFLTPIPLDFEATSVGG